MVVLGTKVVRGRMVPGELRKIADVYEVSFLARTYEDILVRIRIEVEALEGES